MTRTESDPQHVDRIDGSSSVELSSNRTSLSFERTRMSADRTLMSVVRTSLSMISFGFTIYKVFTSAAQSGLIGSDLAARRVGLLLLSLGLLLLVMGIATHFHFGHQLNLRRQRLYGMRLVHEAVPFPVTPTFVIAILLLLVGAFALISIALRMS